MYISQHQSTSVQKFHRIRIEVNLYPIFIKKKIVLIEPKSLKVEKQYEIYANYAASLTRVWLISK